MGISWFFPVKEATSIPARRNLFCNFTVRYLPNQLNKVFSSNRTTYKGMASSTQHTEVSRPEGRRGVVLVPGRWAGGSCAPAQTTDSTHTLEAAPAYATRNNHDLNTSGFDKQLANRPAAK